MILCIPKKWINKYIALNILMEFAFKKVKAISCEGKLSRPLPLFYSIDWLEAMDHKMNYIFWVSGFNSILKKTFPFSMKLEFHITYTYMQKLCNKDEIIILVSYVQNKIFMVIGKVMKLQITYTNEKVITFVLQSQISNY